MKIVVGLGNPGPKYETTRHNVGFLAADRLIDKWQASGPLKKNQAEIYEAKVNGEKVLVIKPQTYMNLSGRSVGPLFSFYKLEPSDLIVIHDDLDLQPLTIRIKTGGGTGGHNGLKSVDENLGNDKTGYHRIRIGIGRGDAGAVDHVLDQLSDQELSVLDKLLDQVADAVEQTLKGNVQAAMTKYNRREQ